ncbi:MAG: hypothetical protein H6Q65_403 [Firmicutes bacterium]|nr:hypothetical protein [Bacillota bacterium]
MNRIWLEILGALLVGGMLKYAISNEAVVWVVIDLVILGVCYLLLQRYPFVDTMKSMKFLAGLTVINILVDIGLISAGLGNLILLVIILWVLFKGHFNKPFKPHQRTKIRHKWHK